MLGAHPVSSHTLLRGPMLKSAHACHGVMWASLCKQHHVRIVPPANMTSWSTPTSIIAATRRCSVRMSARRRAVSPDANTTWMLASTKSKAVPTPEGTRQRKAQKNGSRENLLHDTAEKPSGQREQKQRRTCVVHQSGFEGCQGVPHGGPAKTQRTTPCGMSCGELPLLYQHRWSCRLHWQVRWVGCPEKRVSLALTRCTSTLA